VLRTGVLTIWRRAGTLQIKNQVKVFEILRTAVKDHYERADHTECCMTPPIEVIEKKLKQNGVHRFFVRIMKLDKHVIEAFLGSGSGNYLNPATLSYHCLRAAHATASACAPASARRPSIGSGKESFQWSSKQAEQNCEEAAATSTGDHGGAKRKAGSRSTGDHGGAKRKAGSRQRSNRSKKRPKLTKTERVTQALKRLAADMSDSDVKHMRTLTGPEWVRLVHNAVPQKVEHPSAKAQQDQGNILAKAAARAAATSNTPADATSLSDEDLSRIASSGTQDKEVSNDRRYNAQSELRLPDDQSSEREMRLRDHFSEEAPSLVVACTSLLDMWFVGGAHHQEKQDHERYHTTHIEVLGGERERVYAFDDTDVIGILSLSDTANERGVATIFALGVHPDFQRCCIASQMLATYALKNDRATVYYLKSLKNEATVRHSSIGSWHE
jgi:ribosomal protein S18 acetylase RimI-like enzyme